MDQDREHNHVNEIDTDDVHGEADNPITETTGTAWADPVHDAAGNMTTVPKPASLANGYTCKYDAWNRLVEVKDGETPIGFYEYDALNRRLFEGFYWSGGQVNVYYHRFWNSSWQCLEMRSTTSATAQPENLSVDWQYVWSARYIDAALLRDRNRDGNSQTGDLGKPGSGLEERFYYLADANFNVTCLVGTDGDPLEHYLYDPYGKLTVLNGASGDGDGSDWTADPGNASDGYQPNTGDTGQRRSGGVDTCRP